MDRTKGKEGIIITRAVMHPKVISKTRRVNLKKLKTIFLDMSLSMDYQGRIKPTEIKEVDRK